MTPRARSEKRRREIISAALQCFTSLGFAATTIDDIRSRSRASTGSIYHHFGGKEQLAAAVYVEGLRDFQSGLLETMRRHDDAERGIRSLVEFHLDWVGRNPCWARYLFQMSQAPFVVSAKPVIREINREFLVEVMRWVQPRVERGELVAMPTDLFSAVVIGPCQEFARHWLEGQVRSRLAEARAVLADAAWQALRPRR